MNGFLKILYRLHVYVGLFVALHFFLLSATGSILLFRHGWDSAEKVESASVPTAYSAVLANALAKFPQDRPLSLFPDEDLPHILQLRLGEDGTRKFRGARKLTYEGASAREAKLEPESGFFASILLLHRDLYLGSWGKLYVGFAGLLVAFTLVSGLFTYGRFMRGRSYGEIRRNSLGLLSADLHKFLGVTLFAWAILVACTGCFLAFNGVLIKFYQKRELASLNAKYVGEPPGDVRAIAPVDRVIAAALAARPGTKFSFLAFPDTEFSLPNHFLVLVNGASALEEKVSELVVVDARTGQVTETRALPWYLKFEMLSEPLHFGDYGGPALKAVWLAFALLTGLLGLSGPAAYIWKRRGHIREGSERIRNLRLPAVFGRAGFTLPLGLGLACLGGLLGALWGALDSVAWLAAGLPLAAVCLLLLAGLREGKA